MVRRKDLAKGKAELKGALKMRPNWSEEVFKVSKVTKQKSKGLDLDACSYHVLTTVDLPGDVAVAKQILRRLEAAFIESALAREEPLQNKNEPLCKCERTRQYQAQWRERHPNYMKIKGREWRAKRKAQRLAIEQQTTESQQ